MYFLADPLPSVNRPSMKKTNPPRQCLCGPTLSSGKTPLTSQSELPLDCLFSTAEPDYLFELPELCRSSGRPFRHHICMASSFQCVVKATEPGSWIRRGFCRP
ncbi:hypothetical protein K443DRAFT_638932 [Laccaria amethystina LaAM-08-1]|uniref:Uncharacterized protein n=1 Tax=Laccaria amethystina LaAM-08-1 TaxID=1095629 RepID=A0A0C9XC60_9AGAR|nr:hypothetical protein K443DRAFT_638932 [Laccaria amethystina LaAM-08-1]